MRALLFDRLDGFLSQVRLDNRIDVLEYLQLALFKRRAEIALDTTGTLAFIKVADKLLTAAALIYPPDSTYKFMEKYR